MSTQASLDTVVEPGGWGDWHGQKGGGVVLECVASKEGYDALITCLITQCTNEFVYTGSVDRSVRVWDAKTGQGVKTLQRSGEGEEVDPSSATSRMAVWAGMSMGAHNVNGGAQYLESRHFEWQGQVGAYDAPDSFTKQGQFRPGSVDAVLFLPPLKSHEGGWVMRVGRSRDVIVTRSAEGRVVA